MRILITAGPTHEPIDSIRFIANRSSGKMGAALAAAALKAGHATTLILGPVTPPLPANLRRIDIQTAADMLAATLAEFPAHDLLILAAAVADFTPKTQHPGKLPRNGDLSIDCHPTADIAAAAGRAKRPDQRTVGFSLESQGDLPRARRKLQEKNLDLIVFNTPATINSQTIDPTLLYPDGTTVPFPSASKATFADILIERSTALF